MGRVIVVSGGGTGIGRAVAALFAAQGDDVVVTGRRADVLTRTADELNASSPDGSVTTIPADLREPGDAARVQHFVRDKFGRVDVVVSNAGGNILNTGDPAGFTGLDRVVAHWEGNFRANVLTAVLLIESLTEMLSDQGRIVLISSIAAFRGSGSGSYAGAKAALHPYACDLAAALGVRGITVNVVAPGYVEGTEFFAGALSPDRREGLVRQTLTGNPGQAADVAETIGWLASPGARHVTAQIIQVNGGAQPGR